MASISIHAPSRERPRFQPHTFYRQDNFNPRSLTGATTRSGTPAAGRHHFNPRSLTGATRDVIGELTPTAISIHAPSRERPRISVLTCSNIYFNPRSLTGATLIRWPIPTRRRFQSTLPHGSDQFERDFDNLGLYFNPRSLTGATLPWSISGAQAAYFNPRSLTGATCTDCLACFVGLISIHAPSRERH